MTADHFGEPTCEFEMATESRESIEKTYTPWCIIWKVQTDGSWKALQGNESQVNFFADRLTRSSQTVINKNSAFSRFFADEIKDLRFSQ